ncbi:MAG TPA: hypothetical protein VF614_07575 [Chthoniobacteraceae bacterium]|jgi:hypothetical protein
MNIVPQRLHSEHWIAFLDASKGSPIHRILDVIFCALLCVGMFGGAFAGFLLSQHFGGDYLLAWGLGSMLVGLYCSCYSFIGIRCRILKGAFQHYLAGLQPRSQRDLD